jgi:hypothetical protein
MTISNYGDLLAEAAQQAQPQRSIVYLCQS